MNTLSAKPKPFKQRNLGSNGGLYLVMVAMLVFVLASLAALVFGLGLLSTGNARLRNIANIAAIGAIESFVQSTSPTYDLRAQAALDRARQLLASNSEIPGVGEIMSDIGSAAAHGTEGYLELGKWYPEAASDINNRCSNYPCFRANSPPNVGSGANPNDPADDGVANAARIVVHSRPDNPLIVPFTRVFNAGALLLHAEALGTVTQRCTAYMLDTSLSVTEETHIIPTRMTFDEDPVCIADPINGVCSSPCYKPKDLSNPDNDGLYSLFAYDWARISAKATNCNRCGAYTTGGNFDQEFMYWCNMEANRTANPSVLGHLKHFKSDYQPQSGQFHYGPPPQNDIQAVPNAAAQAWKIDHFFEGYTPSYMGPEPLTRYFLAFNAALRTVNQLHAPGDKAMMYAFRGDKVSSMPPIEALNPSTPQPALESDLARLIQLTNFNARGLRNMTGNIGSYAHVDYNAINFGWFPIYSSDDNLKASNHVKAIYDVVQILAQCPPTASKAIILATDGLPTCSADYPSTQGQPISGLDCSLGSGNDIYATHYLNAEAELLGDVKDDLVRKGIALTVILDSNFVQPSYRIEPVAGPDTIYLTPDQALANGNYCALTEPGGQPCNSFFDISTSIPLTWQPPPCPSGSPAGCSPTDRTAFINSGAPNVHFRRPIGMWQQIAYDTGGVLCMIMPACAPTCYETDPNNPLGPKRLIYEDIPPGCPQPSDTYLRCAPLQQTKSEQAVACALGAIGSNPYQNVAELPQ